MVKQNIRTRKNNQRKRRTKIQKGGHVITKSRCRAMKELGSANLTDPIFKVVNKYSKSVIDTCPVDSAKSGETKLVKKPEDLLKDLGFLLINNNLFEEERIQFTFNCFKNFRAYGCPYESIVMAEDTTFENFLNFSSFANSFEDVEFLDLRNVKDMAYIPMNLSKMISLKYLLLPNEFTPPPEEDQQNSRVNELHIFDIIRMMPSLRYVEKLIPKTPGVEAAKAKAEAAKAAKEKAEEEAKEDQVLKRAIEKWGLTSNQQIKPGEQKAKPNELQDGSIFKIPTDILEMYGTTPKNGEDLKIRKILEKFKDNNNVLMFPKLDYKGGVTYQPNLIVNFSGESFYQTTEIGS